MTQADTPRQVARLKEELTRAREKVVALETRLAEVQEEAGRGRQQRQALSAEIEFIGEFDVVVARGVDLSTGGICFEVAEPLRFEMRFHHGGVQRQHQAQLIWARSQGTGSRLGFRFSEDEEDDS